MVPIIKMLSFMTLGIPQRAFKCSTECFRSHRAGNFVIAGVGGGGGGGILGSL